MNRSIHQRLCSPQALVRSSARRAVLGVTAALLAGSLVAVATDVSSAASLAPRTRPMAAPPTPGKWIPLGGGLSGVVESGTPTVWISPADTATIIWMRQPSSGNFTYEEAGVSPLGKVSSGPSSIFGTGTWGSLSAEPTLVSNGGKPLLIMQGGKGTKGPLSFGCIVGAVPGSPAWSVLGWSLSNNCNGPIGGAAATRSGQFAAAWPGGWPGGSGVQYRVGLSPAIPALGNDGRIPLSKGDAFKAGVAADAASGANDHVYVAFARENSSPSTDGYYVKDVTANSATRKAPDSGTNSINHIGIFDDLAVTSSIGHPGIFMSYCSNANTCNLELWRVGASKALTVPRSANAYSVAISAGPDGRIWLAWYDEANSTVSTVRTNASDTAFGPVETFATPCFEFGLVGVSGGSYARLDVALQCELGSAKIAEYVTQSLAGLWVSPSKTTIKNSTANKVTFKVTDVGAPIVGAVVRVDGRSATTGKLGTATITFPKGAPTGTFQVTAKATNYFPAHAAVVIKT